jgi:hypothetical protein
MKWGDYLLDEFDLYDTEVYPNGYDYQRAYSIWCYDHAENHPFLNIEYYKPTGYSPGFIRTNGSMTLLVNRESSVIGNGNHCYIVTEVRPEIEYYVSFGFLSQVKEEVNDSLSNGWNLIGGFSNNSSSSCSQAIWRWAE